MLVYSFNRFYVVTKFILPTVEDLKFSTLNFVNKLEYLQENRGQHSEEKQYILDLITYCRKIRPFILLQRANYFSYPHSTLHSAK